MNDQLSNLPSLPFPAPHGGSFIKSSVTRDELLQNIVVQKKRQDMVASALAKLTPEQASSSHLPQQRDAEGMTMSNIVHALETIDHTAHTPVPTHPEQGYLSEAASKGYR